MNERMLPIVLIMTSIIIVSGALGGILLNNHLQEKHQAKVEISEKASDRKRQAAKNDQALRLRICLAEAATSVDRKNDCYERFKTGILPTVTMEGLNALPDIK